MRRLGFAAAAVVFVTFGGLSFAFALDAPSGSSDPKPRAAKSAALKGKAKRQAKSSKTTKPPVAHSFSSGAVKRDYAIRHPKLAPTLNPTDVGMKWSAGNDRARDVRGQTVMNRTPPTGGKVGLKLPF